MYGLIIAGALVTGVGAVLLAEGANLRSNDQHIVAMDDRDNALGYASLYEGLGIVHLAVGVPLLTVGLLARRNVSVPDRAANVSFVPIVSGSRVGCAFALRF